MLYSSTQFIYYTSWNCLFNFSYFIIHWNSSLLLSPFRYNSCKAYQIKQYGLFMDLPRDLLLFMGLLWILYYLVFLFIVVVIVKWQRRNHNSGGLWDICSCQWTVELHQTREIPWYQIFQTKHRHIPHFLVLINNPMKSSKRGKNLRWSFHCLLKQDQIFRYT